MSAKKGLFSTWMAILGVAVLIGLYTTYKLFADGHVLFNTNDVIIWSLPLGVYIYLALASSGLTILSAFPLVFGIRKYEPFAKRLVFLAIATLCGAFVSIGLELGNVFHMVYIMLSPNFSSPIWWMGAIYSVELVVLIVKFALMHKGDWHSGFSRLLAQASFLLAIVAPLMIGSIFHYGIQGNLLWTGDVDLLPADGIYERNCAISVLQPGGKQTDRQRCSGRFV